MKDLIKKALTDKEARDAGALSEYMLEASDEQFIPWRNAPTV